MDIDYTWLLLPFLIAWFAWHLYRLHDEAWRLRKAERQAVLDWHPKCETCGHFILNHGTTEDYPGDPGCALLDIVFGWNTTLHEDKFGCLEHTSLRGEEE